MQNIERAELTDDLCYVDLATIDTLTHGPESHLAELLAEADNNGVKFLVHIMTADEILLHQFK